MMRALLLFSSLFLTILYANPTQQGAFQYNKHCAACHGISGEKRAWNVTEPLAGWNIQQVKEALIGYKNRTRDHYGYGDYMHPQIKKYSVIDIDLIATYVATLKGHKTPHIQGN